MQETMPSGFSLPDTPHQRAVGRLIRVMRRHHACAERRIGDLGIHHGQLRMLRHLARRGEESFSQRDLAESMGISPAAVTATLGRLEKEGYVQRSATDGDNRKNEIRITDEGRAKLRESHAVFESVDRDMFAGFSEEEMTVLSELLVRIDQNLDAAGAPSEPVCRPHHRKEE